MNTDHPKAIDVIHILMRSTYFIQREFQSQLTTFDTPFPLTGPRLRLLSVVAETGKIRMNELAAKLGIKARTVTDFVDALEQDKLLVRIPDPTDRRATLIQLTELAQSNIEQALIYQDKIANKVLENLSVEQQKQFFELLLQLIKDKDISDTCEEAKK
ncbi:MarR family transcriptional regulator [Paenibacillus sp. MY03]|jgi:DNA-binding MarR family transcriptional regulator|uniref:MarR family transcriptional regulator n=1 Tax=Paenibacillus agaridevorans TaxID=171404 RepID=A0A2R5ERL0_9BACL|nr:MULTISPECIES: MarR family transcriptional regulator [Paenibacillus]OUS77178.1 MarR family transcriptional regulator [Paenibacillus sp. MY03]GBG07688.1 MarR family transcriptional regulator [Paenibacillus agaridevorans]